MIINQHAGGGVGRTSSSLARQSATNAPLRKALSAIPNFDLVTKMQDDLLTGAKTIDPPLAPAVTSETRASLADGNGLPADLLDRYTAAVIAEQSYTKASIELQILFESLAAEKDQLVTDGLDTVCAALDADLKRVYQALRKVRSAPATAADAIERGDVAGYKKGAALRIEYAEIRRAQRLLLVHGLGPDDDLFDSLSKGWPMVAHASNLLGVWPDLPEWDRYGTKPSKDGRRIRLTPPWPDPDTEPFLDWLLDHPEAEPWVPTFDQAAELLNQIKTRVLRQYEGQRPDQVAAAREYELRRSPHLAHLIEAGDAR